MINLKCKTREGTSSNNKPKIYFSCHHDDFQSVYEEYSGLLLELHLEEDLNKLEDTVSALLEKFNN